MVVTDFEYEIQMFPELVWEEATLIVGALTLVQATALVILATAYLLLSRQRPSAGSADADRSDAQPQPQAPPPQAQPPGAASS